MRNGGETPCAFVELKEGDVVSEQELKAWCRDHLAAFKVPGHFEFEAIPKTSTGKNSEVCIAASSL